MKITAEFKQRGEDDYLPRAASASKVITAEKALSILKNVSDEDCESGPRPRARASCGSS